MDVKGTVTISLDDYHRLLKSKEQASVAEANTKRAAKELAVFLSFLASRENIAPHVQEFNRQSSTSKILLDQGRARIQFVDDKD